MWWWGRGREGFRKELLEGAGFGVEERPGLRVSYSLVSARLDWRTEERAEELGVKWKERGSYHAASESSASAGQKQQQPLARRRREASARRSSLRP